MLAPLGLAAFPPAPPHTLFGALRDEFGTAISRSDALVEFVAENGVRIQARVIPGLAPGVNYEILIPMDAGIAPDLYRPNAMRPSVPFRLMVRMGGQTYLPIEMSGDLRELGKPAGSTRLDLTLGVDSDGDGIPDAWKDMVIASMGGGLPRSAITPDGDLDGDGMSNFDEYIAGTYAWDPADRLWLEIAEVVGDVAVLDFAAIDGRSYFIEASADMRTWRRIPFRIPAVDSPGQQRSSYFATAVRHRRVHVLVDPQQPMLYRLGVQ